MAEDKTFLYEDIYKLDQVPFIPWEKLERKTILLTGATGLIGAAVIRVLDYINSRDHLNIRILALVRNADRAKQRFENIKCPQFLVLVPGSVEMLPEIEEEIDYIIHGASQTASREFVCHAVETIHTAVAGTKNLLELAKEKKAKGFIYLSSMEVYGYPEKGHKVRENEIGRFNPENLRNSYPIGKILCEAMCAAYAGEYQIPAKVIRLTQTIGSDVNENDARVWAYFGRCVKEKKNIVLKTAGETERCYLYTTDAATAILTVLLKGEPGQAYNAADESTYCSIAEMAEKVASQGGIHVEYDIQDTSANGFPDTLYMDLDTSRLRQLGWFPVNGGGVAHLAEVIANLEFYFM